MLLKNVQITENIKLFHTTIFAIIFRLLVTNFAFFLFSWFLNFWISTFLSFYDWFLGFDRLLGFILIGYLGCFLILIGNVSWLLLSFQSLSCKVPNCRVDKRLAFRVAGFTACYATLNYILIIFQDNFIRSNSKCIYSCFSR